MINDLTSVSKLKENLLALLSIIYGIGLISWNVYAYVNSLGIVSGLESQYLVAGFVPFLILVYTWWFFKHSKKWFEDIQKRLSRKVRGTDRIKRITIIYLPFVVVLIMLFLAIVLEREEDKFFIILPFILIMFCLGGALRPADVYPFFLSKKVKGNFRLLSNLLRTLKKINIIFSNFSKYYFLMILTLFLLPFYFLVLYPKIPWELGGVRPKQCVLIFEQDKLVADRLFFTPKHSLQQTKFILSDTITAYYYNDDKVIVKVSSNTTIEIDKKNIDAIIWINK